MKFHFLPPSVLLSVLPLATIASLSPSLTTSASAACVMIDPSVQVAVHGSPLPAQQSNTVTMTSDGRCLGAVTDNTSEQIYVGPGPIEQNRESHHFTGGDPSIAPGEAGPVIGIPVYVPVDVYAPAYDPNFYGGLPAYPTDYSGYSPEPNYQDPSYQNPSYQNPSYQNPSYQWDTAYPTEYSAGY